VCAQIARGWKKNDGEILVVRAMLGGELPSLRDQHHQIEHDHVRSDVSMMASASRSFPHRRTAMTPVSRLLSFTFHASPRARKALRYPCAARQGLV
jgi:hypothetical protein